MSDRNAGDLFNAVVSASGLAPIIAGAVIRRACQRAGVDPTAISHAGLTQALESIETSLRVYLSPPEVAERMAAVKRLVR
jgi:hypothetical protein